MDQKSFANLIDATVSALSNWENGRNAPNDIRLKAIADIAGISVDKLKYGNELERKKRNEDIEIWKRTLENYTDILESVENFHNSNYHKNLIEYINEVEEKVSYILSKINTGEVTLDDVTTELHSLEDYLEMSINNTYGEMEELFHIINTAKYEKDLANRKLKELGYDPASDSKLNPPDSD